MRRVLAMVAAAATVVLGVAAQASPAGAADAGVVTVTSTYSGNDGCFDPPGTITVALEGTGTLSAGGQTYLGPFRTQVGGTYVQGSCSIRDPHGGLQAFLDVPGVFTGMSAAGSVAGTCVGGSLGFGPLTGSTPLPEPRARGALFLACDVAVDGGAPARVVLSATLAGTAGVTSASHVGVYTTV